MVTFLSLAIALACIAAPASAQPFLPPPGKVFAGVAGQPLSSYENAVGKHPAVDQEFVA